MSSFDDLIRSKFEDVELHPEQMHSYQRDLAIPFLKANPFSMLLLDMGLGKTIISGTVISDLLAEFATDKVLVIGPLRVMTDTWPAEFRKWSHLAPWNTCLIREDDDDPRIKEGARIDRRPENMERRKALRERAEKVKAEAMKALDQRGLRGQRRKNAMKEINRVYDESVEVSMETQARLAIRAELARSEKSIHFINRENVEWLVNLHGPKWPYRTVIIDESDSFKDHSSERFKALAKVRRTPGLIERMHLLTATPDSEGVDEYFAQIYLLDLGKRLGKNITEFREQYMVQNQWTKQWSDRPGAEDEILKLISDICLVLKAKDYLNLDEPNIVARPIHLPRKAMEFYEQMAKDSVVQVEGRDVEAETAAALSGKLQQIASGVLYETYLDGDWETEDMTKVKKVHHIHDAKIETLREIAEALHGKPVVVVYHFKASLDRLRKAFPKAISINDKEYTQAKWDKGKFPMLLVHPASAGHGLNLQYGSHQMVMFDIPWPLRQYLQVIGRLARQGQKFPVLVQLLIAVGTVDEDVWDSLKIKEDAQSRRREILDKHTRKYRHRVPQHDPL
jgi:hypothetical protein